MLQFQSENFSNWVIGPELGKFIAGIRNDETPICVHDVQTAWKYASRAAEWRSDDKTLTVKCYEPTDDDNDAALAFGSRRTTTRLPVTFGRDDDTTISTKRIQEEEKVRMCSCKRICREKRT